MEIITVLQTVAGGITIILGVIFGVFLISLIGIAFEEITGTEVIYNQFKKITKRQKTIFLGFIFFLIGILLIIAVPVMVIAVGEITNGGF
jgi:hypothetical protein